MMVQGDPAAGIQGNPALLRSDTMDSRATDASGGPAEQRENPHFP